MVYLVAGMGNVYIDLIHAIIGIIAVITVMKMYQMIQYVLCILNIALKDVSYSDHFCLILQSILPQLYSTNTASTALQQ